MSTHQRLQFPATRAAFDQAWTAFRAALDAAGVRGRPRQHAELVFEEVVSNVIRHGGGDGPRRRVDVAIAVDADGLVLTFDDDGPPFDPLARPTLTLPSSLDAATLGGLGILLLRKAATELRYERTADERNRLIVTIAAR